MRVQTLNICELRFPRWLGCVRIVRMAACLGLLAILCVAARAAEPQAQAWMQDGAGGSRVAARISIPDGFYLYDVTLGDPKVIGLPLTAGVRGATVTGYATSPAHPKAQPLFDGSGKTVNANVHTASAELFLTITRSVPASPVLVLRGQMCSDAQCQNFTLEIPVAAAGNDPAATALFARFPAAAQLLPPPASWGKLAAALKASGGARDGAQANTSANAISTGGEAEDISASRTNAADAVKPVRGGMRGGSVLDLLPPSTTPAPATPPAPQMPQTPDRLVADGAAGIPAQPADVRAVAGGREAEAAQVADIPDFEVRTVLPERSLALWLAVAFLAGVLLNFMPCVLPVVSLKIISLINQSGEDRARLLRLSLSFSAGMILVFLLLAGLAIGAGLHWGEQFQSEAFNIALTVLVFAFALSFFGVYEFGVPDAANRLQAGGLPREGYAGAFCTGMLATILATPCSGPFLGATLTWALTQTPAVVLLVFFFLGLGMAVPYVLLSLSPRLRSLLPKPGAWMLTFRQVMGFVLLLTVVYLLIFVEPQHQVPTAGLLVAAAFGCWLLGRFGGALRPFARRWLVRLAAAGVIAGSAALLFGPIKPILSGFSQVREGGPSWLVFDEAAFRADIAAGRNVLLDFTADWCMNCKYNEYAVFGTNAVTQALVQKNVVCYQVDLTDEGPETARAKAFLKKLGGSAIPYAVFFPAKDAKHPIVLPDILTTGRVLSAIKQLPDAEGRER